MIFLTVSGCVHIKGAIQGNLELNAAKELMLQGDQQAALAKYEDISGRFPSIGDQALFPLGSFYMRPDGTKANYQKSLGYFQRLLKEYPESRFREETELLTSLIQEILNREQRFKTSESRTDSLQKKVNALETQIEKMKKIDKSVEAKKRRVIPQK